MHNHHPTPISGPIISIGDLVADFIVSIPLLPAVAGHHQLARTFQMEPGGSANFLIAGARLGLPMTAIGAVGDDEWGRAVLQILQDEGVSVEGVRLDGETTCVTVLVDELGEHVFLGRLGHGSAFSLSSADRAAIEAGSALFFSGWTLAEERLRSMTVAGLALATQRKLPIFFDPGPMVQNVSEQLLRDVLPHVHTLLLTQDELPLLPAADPAQLLLDPRMNLQTIVIKRGSNGCTIWHRDETMQPQSLHGPAYPVKVVDTSAAGDCFDAAWVAATLWGWPLHQRAAFANASGSIIVQRLGGGRAVPTFAEITAKKHFS